eukprot:TRINITY_DN128_c0_g1_i2.p2 TRINITY_DN128_c0_g1~~TRINITY_DN128_c0_g1_i2.p2  ORF type:complete len:179 (+),score=22.15 TRINITY_DN128_c0_g1_i2:509-1045(+)
MRLWVRPGVRISLSSRFSRADGSAPDTSQVDVLCQPCTPIAGQSDSGGSGCQKEKRTLPGTAAGVSGFGCVATQYPRPGAGMLTSFPFGQRRPEGRAFDRRLPRPQDRLTHVQLLFTWNPSPLQSSKVSFEQLLLPPRSALEPASPELTLQAATQAPRPPTHGRDYAFPPMAASRWSA